MRVQSIYYKKLFQSNIICEERETLGNALKHE